MLKLTKGTGIMETVLKEETRRPVVSREGNAIPSDSEFCGKGDEGGRVRTSDRIMVSEFGTWRMKEVTAL